MKMVYFSNKGSEARGRIGQSACGGHRYSLAPRDVLPSQFEWGVLNVVATFASLRIELRSQM